MKALAHILILLLLTSTCIFAQKKKQSTVKATQSSKTTQSREELEKQRITVLEEIQRTQNALNDLQKDKKSSLEQLNALQAKLQARKSLIDNINKEVSYIEDNLQNTNVEVSVLKTKLDTLRKQYAEMVRYTYKNRTSYDMIVFLFSSNTFNDAIRRLRYVKQYRNYRADQAAKIIYTGKELEEKLALLNQQKNVKDIVLSAQQQQNKILEEETQQTNKVVTELKGKEKELLVALAIKKRNADDLNRTIASIIRREIEIARKKALEEQARIARERKAKMEQEKRMAIAKKQQEEIAKRNAQEKAKREEQERKMAIAKKQQEEKERQLLAERKAREEQERKLALERKMQEEQERKASKLAQEQRIQRERELAIERKKQEDKARALLAEKQAQEERQRKLAIAKKLQESEQRRITQEATASNYTNNKTAEEEVEPTPVKRNSDNYISTPDVEAITSNFEAGRGRLPWPVGSGFISEHFGKQKHPVFNIYTENFGVDIKTSRGAAARSVFAGEVTSVVSIAGTGQTVIISHGNYFTVYSKLAKVNVSKGMRVSSKQTIGSVLTDDEGNTQIHFEVWKVGSNGAPYKLNPEQWVAQ